MKDPEMTYNMPETTNGKIKCLCKVMNLRRERFSQLSDERVARVLTGVVLYHHLPRSQQPSVMRDVRALPGPLVAALMPKITDPMVNKVWGVWALDSEELFQYQTLFETVSTLGGALGLSFSAPSAKGILSDLNSKVRMGSPSAVSGSWLNLAATALIWGFFWNNESARQTIQEEINRRAGKKIEL